MKMKITFISDTHGKHNQLTKDLPGGDILIHAGDFMNAGYSKYEALDFFVWLESINTYDTKVFIAGNHDRIMEFDTQTMLGELTGFKTIDYLQDEEIGIYHDDLNGDHSEDNIHIYGSPWQPEFFNWAFNLPRNGDELKERWDAIPNHTDILVTHGPPFGFLDIPGHGTPMNVGCEMLRYRIDELRPKIHVFGHIHGSRSVYYNGSTLFVNASVLDERYRYTNKPIHIEFDFETLEYEVIQI
jgi:Icc-related predicted phosphoesterase